VQRRTVRSVCWQELKNAGTERVRVNAAAGRYNRQAPTRRARQVAALRSVQWAAGRHPTRAYVIRRVVANSAAWASSRCGTRNERSGSGKGSSAGYSVHHRQAMAKVVAPTSKREVIGRGKACVE